MRLMTGLCLVSSVKNFLYVLNVSVCRVDEEAVQVEEHEMHHATKKRDEHVMKQPVYKSAGTSIST